jgi:N utilization substance protein B
MNRSGRHGARQLLMQALYQHLLSGTAAEELQSEFAARAEFEFVDQAYFSMLMDFVFDDLSLLDADIAAHADRSATMLDPVERAILWVGIAELRKSESVPRNVVIDEAVQLARDFGATESHRFINAVLDRIATQERGATR